MSIENIVTQEAPNKIRVDIVLYDKLYTIERKAYTVFMLISDVGGFNGAVIFSASILMSFYSERMYSAEIAKEVPVRKRNKRQ